MSKAADRACHRLWYAALHSVNCAGVTSTHLSKAGTGVVGSAVQAHPGQQTRHAAGAAVLAEVLELAVWDIQQLRHTRCAPALGHHLHIAVLAPQC